MITFKIKDLKKSITIPTSYSDISVNQLNEIIDNRNNEEKLIHLLTGLSVAEAAFIQFDIISEYLSFLDESPYKLESDNFIQLDQERVFLIPENIGSGSYGSKIMALKSYRENKPLRLVSVYLQPKIDKGPLNIERLEEVERELSELKVSQVYPLINHVAAELKRWTEIEKKVLSSQPTPEQIRAGIDMFNQLGEFNSIDMLAQGKPWRYNEILNLDYSTIFNKLLKINLSATFERNLNDLKTKTE